MLTVECWLIDGVSFPFLSVPKSAAVLDGQNFPRLFLLVTSSFVEGGWPVDRARNDELIILHAPLGELGRPRSYLVPVLRLDLAQY